MVSVFEVQVSIIKSTDSLNGEVVSESLLAFWDSGDCQHKVLRLVVEPLSLTTWLQRFSIKESLPPPLLKKNASRTGKVKSERRQTNYS